MVAKATGDIIIIMFLSWLMLIGVSIVMAFLLQELPKSTLLSIIRVFIGIVLIGLWLVTWFKFVSFYFWRKIKRNYMKRSKIL
jgi:energy-coupling factor transporter transmembrane protein EcfT